MKKELIGEKEFELAKVKELLESAERFIGEVEKIIEEKIGR